MEAILWDGNKQIYGALEFYKTELIFQLKDFENTNLNLKILYKNITRIEYHKVYNLDTMGVQIHTIDGKSNVFVVDKPKELKKIIEELRK